jgi:hypothetical protein
MANKVNWRKIKTEYIRDLTASHRSLAAKYGVAVSAVSKRAAEEGWAQARKEYNEKVVQEMLQECARADAQVLARFKAAAEKALEKVEEALADPDQFYRYRVEANAREFAETRCTEVERVYKTLNAKALKEVTDTARELLVLYRNASGQPEWGTQFSAIMAYMKLENEREKVAIERERAAASDGVANEIVVRFEDEHTGEGDKGGFDA